MNTKLNRMFKIRKSGRMYIYQHIITTRAPVRAKNTNLSTIRNQYGKCHILYGESFIPRENKCTCGKEDDRWQQEMVRGKDGDPSREQVSKHFVSQRRTTIIPCLSYDRSPFHNPFELVQSSGPVIIQAINYNKGTHYFRKRSKLCHGGANAWLQVVCWEHHGASAEAPAQIGL